MPIEPLEPRIAPAILLSFTDVDGDKVSVAISKGAPGAATLTLVDEGLGQRLSALVVNHPSFQGADVTITARPQDVTGDGRPDGDGLVNVERIIAYDTDLGAVTVRGDLVFISTGDAELATPGLAKLSVLSLGRQFSGTGPAVDVDGKLGALVVATDMSARVTADRIGSIAIGGSMISEDVPLTVSTADPFPLLANITADTIGPVKIGGDIVGGGYNFNTGSGENRRFSGSQILADSLVSLTVGGSLLGGSYESSALVSVTGAIGPVKIGGDLRGGDGEESAVINSGTGLGAVSVGGSLVGGAGKGSARIESAGNMGDVRIAGSLIGAGQLTARLFAHAKVTSLTIGGSVLGGTEVESGEVRVIGAVGALKIGGDLRGGTAINTGLIEASSDIASVAIGGSVIGTSASITGSILSLGKIGRLTVAGDLRGGDVDGGLTQSGYLLARRFGSIIIGGSIHAGEDISSGTGTNRTASIRANLDIGSLTVKGSLVGGAPGSDAGPIVISAFGTPGATGAKDMAIGKITVGGRVERAEIYAGFSPTFAPADVNADAQIGRVTVGGDWLASILIAGVAPNAGGFGDANDAALTGGKDLPAAVSKIASVVIKGQAIGTRNPDDAAIFSIEAQSLGAISIGGVAQLVGDAGDRFTRSDPLGATFRTGVQPDFIAFQVP